MQLHKKPVCFFRPNFLDAALASRRRKHKKHRIPIKIPIRQSSFFSEVSSRRKPYCRKSDLFIPILFSI